MTILYVVAAISLATNIALLRDGSRTARVDAHLGRAELTAVELDRGRFGANFPTAFGLRQILRESGMGDGHRLPLGGEGVRLTGLLAARAP